MKQIRDEIFQKINEIKRESIDVDNVSKNYQTKMNLHSVFLSIELNVCAILNEICFPLLK